MTALKIVVVLSFLASADALRLLMRNATQNATNATQPKKVAPQNATNGTQPKTMHKLTAEEQVATVAASLKTIQNLKAMFTSDDALTSGGISEMAAGGMTTELSKKDSAVWTTIAAMVNASQKVMTEMKGKSKADADKLMDNLEKEMNNQSVVLDNVSDRVAASNEKHSAEYVLGLLNMHAKDWSTEKQLNVTMQFKNGSLAVWELAASHDMNKPFAPQLAAIMDEEKQALVKATEKASKKNATKTANNTAIAKVVTPAKVVAANKAIVAKKAAKQFIQLVASLHEMRA